MDNLLITEDFGPVRRLTMNAPKKLNALSDAMLAALNAAFDDLEKEQETIRVVILRGSGKAFCAGHDLGEMQHHGPNELNALFKTCSGVMTRILRLPQPVIAQVHGIATAAGCQLVATCDLAVAETGTRFGVNGVNIGLFCSTPMVALSRNIPRKQAFEMLTTGDFIDADRACDLGLINHVVAAGDLEQTTMVLATKIAGKLGVAVRIGKRAFYEQIQMPIAQAYDYTGAVMVENMAEKDTAEGIAAFLEKRAPDWQS